MDERSGWVNEAVGWPAWRLCRLTVILGSIAVAMSVLTAAFTRGQAIRMQERLMNDQGVDWGVIAVVYVLAGVQWFVIAIAGLTAIGTVVRYHHELSRGWHGLNGTAAQERGS